MPRPFKSEQLAAQVRRAVEHALSVQDVDEGLWDLEVLEVEPSAEGSVMTLLVQGHRSLANLPDAELLARVEAARNALVHEVAATISRKKVPEMVFRVMPAGAFGGGGGAQD